MAAGEYQLVAGERRLRAAQLAGLLRVPVIVKDFDDRAMMELALIENIQREDLNPIDEAKAYQALISKVGLTHDQLSERVGKQRATITNSLRLLGLPAEVMDMVSRGTLSSGHARALLGLENRGDQLAAARYVSSKGFSVRRKKGRDRGFGQAACKGCGACGCQRLTTSYCHFRFLPKRVLIFLIYSQSFDVCRTSVSYLSAGSVVRKGVPNHHF